MKNFELGAKVFIEKYYRRNGRTWFTRDCGERYNLLELNKEGFYAGRRLINTKGYSDLIGYEEGYVFVPTEKEQVHLVAINQKQQIYVPDKYIWNFEIYEGK